MGTSRYTNYQPVNWDIPIWSPDWKQVDNLLTNKEQGYQLAQAALDAPIDSSNLGTDPMVREQLRLNREQAQADLAKTYAQTNGLQAGNKALQSYIQQINKEKQPGGVEYQLMQNKANITAYQEKIDKAEGWSPEQKQQWLSMNLSDYKGAVYEGELKGFSGQDISKFINDSLYAQKYLEKMKPSTEEGYVIDTETGQQLTVGGKAIYSGGDGYYYWDKMKNERLSTQAQISAVYPAMQQDPEYQTYMKDKIAIKLYGEAGITKNNWQQAVVIQDQLINSSMLKIDSLKSKNEKVLALNELTGKDYSNVDEKTIDSKLQIEKTKLVGRKDEIKNIKSFNDLLKVEGDNDLLRTVSTNAELYKIDNFSITSERFIDQFALEQVKLQNALTQKKAEEQVILPDYWKETIIKVNDDLVAGADAFDTYEKLSTGLNKYYKELPSNIATLNQEIASIVISKGTEAEILSDVASGSLITDKELKDRIINALNSQKSYDEEGNLMPQKDNVDYHIGQKNGKLYGVMNVNFADEVKGKHSYGVQFEINDETPSLRKFIIEDEQLFQQNELLRTQEIAQQIKSNNTAITNYTLPDGEKFNINLARKVKTSGDTDNSEYQARIILPKRMTDRGGQSSSFIEFNTNDIATAPRIVGILEKISTNADYFKTIKETRFPGDDVGFLKFITQDIVDMTNGKIGAYQATQLYDWMIKPIIDKGQILQTQPQSNVSGNFTSPQGFKW